VVSQTTSLRRQVSWVSNVWWHVAKIFTRFHARRNCQTVSNRAFTKAQFTACRYVEHQFTQWTTGFRFHALELIKGVQTIFSRFDGLTNFPVSIAAFHVQFSQEANGFHRTCLVKCADGFLNDFFVLTFAQFALFTATDQQYTLR